MIHKLGKFINRKNENRRSNLTKKDWKLLAIAEKKADTSWRKRKKDPLNERAFCIKVRFVWNECYICTRVPVLPSMPSAAFSRRVMSATRPGLLSANDMAA